MCVWYDNTSAGWHFSYQERENRHMCRSKRFSKILRRIFAQSQSKSNKGDFIAVKNLILARRENFGYIYIISKKCVPQY